MPEPWQDALKFMNKCPICGQSYAGEAVKFFLRRRHSTVVHSTCRGCQSAFMAMVMTFGRGISSVGMITDLSFDDIRRLYKTEPITIDEVIEGHQLINSEIQITNSLPSVGTP